VNLLRTDEFDGEVEHQFYWYLMESCLDPAPALELAGRFCDAVERTLDKLTLNPNLGQPRMTRFSDLPGYRSVTVQKPFGRFLIFYRIDGQTIRAEQFLEGHRYIASKPDLT